MSAAEMRVASWNLHWSVGSRARRLGGLLHEQGVPRMVLLQEANPRGLDAFCEAAGLEWWVSVQGQFPDLLAVRGRDGVGRSHPRGVAIAGTGDSLRTPVAFPDVPLPEKVMAGWLDVHDTRVTAISYHAPTGVQHKQKKPAQAVKVAHWLRDLAGPVVFAGDFNTPKIDHPDHEKIQTHWHTGRPDLDGAPGDDYLVGPNETHGLRDALRVWFGDHPEDLARVREERPEGPLDVSYRTGQARHARRYDAIWISPHFGVRDITYFYDEALAAGTDHALVIADLTLTAGLA